MRYSLLTVIVITLILVVLTGCERQKQSNTDPEIQKGTVSPQPLPDKSAPNDIEIPVPTAIKDQLVNADDIRDGAELDAKAIVLSADDNRLLITGHGRFLCSPTGNCPYWIFHKTTNGYEQEIEGSAQTVSVETDKSKFPEVLTQQHGSATESELRLYQFDGTHYRLTKCMDERYPDPNDVDRFLDKPIVTEIHC